MFNSEILRPTRVAIWRLVSAASIVLMILVLATDWLFSASEAKMLLVELDSSELCYQLKEATGTQTDRFELTGADWLPSSDLAGYCVIAVNVTGRGAMALVSETRVIEFLRDDAGMPRAKLSRAITL